MEVLHLTVRPPLLLLLLLLLFHPLTSADPEEEEEDNVPVEVVVDSSPCSATCGLGVKTQTLCFLKDGKTAMEDVRATAGAEVSEECRVRRVKCLESWQCGLQTMTVTSGQRVEVDCVGEVLKAMGRFSWRVSWRYARGIISSDDSLFTRLDVPQLDRVILDPIREEDAGTYRCVVQDSAFRRVKRVYWGIRVLPIGVLNLDYESSLAQWDAVSQQNQTTTEEVDRALFHTVRFGLGDDVFGDTVLISLSCAAVGASLILMGLYCSGQGGGQHCTWCCLVSHTKSSSQR